VSGKVVGWAFDRGREASLSPNVRYVLVALADNSNDNGKAWPSRQEIIDKTGLSRATVYRAFGALKRLGLLVEKTDPKGPDYVQLALSHTETPSQSENGASPPEKTESHPETPYIEEPSVEPSVEPSAVDHVFSTWKQVLAPNGGAILTKARRGRILARLKEGYTPERLEAAIRGATQDDWIMGRRPGSPGYTGLDTILRDGDQVERLEKLAPRPPRPKETVH
jgi:biotin operon repressor